MPAPPVDAANAVDAPVQPPIDAPPDAPAADDHGLVLDYEFEDSSTTVTDSSIHAKNGTLTDATAWTAAGAPVADSHFLLQMGFQRHSMCHSQMVC